MYDLVLRMPPFSRFDDLGHFRSWLDRCVRENAMFWATMEAVMDAPGECFVFTITVSSSAGWQDFDLKLPYGSGMTYRRATAQLARQHPQLYSAIWGAR